MKKFLLVSFFGMTSIAAFNQITIDQNDFPGSDDTALVSISDDTNIDLTETGANYTWDYSDLHISSQRIDTFFNLSDASFLYQAQFNNVFTEPDYAADFYSNLIGFDLPGASGAGISISKPVSFVRVTSSLYQNVGIGVELNEIEVPMAADTIDVEYELPMTFGDSWNSDSYIYVDLNPAFNGIFQRYQYRTSEVDGWGTITTRFGTFDVIRVRSEIAYDDSAYLDFGFGGTWLELPTPDEAVYTWWSEGNKVPIMRVVAQSVGSVETITRVEFKDQSRNLAGITESENFAGQIYPNPANGIVNLTFDQGVNQVIIYTISGEIVYQNVVTESALNIDVQTWTSGVYLVKLIGDDAVSSTKLIVE